MQLVLSNNRVVAHGENFLAMGGVVINTETGAKYENATVAECEGCPSDINEVGYEYHAGVFVPCAPYGKGNNNGYFMEVCESCATPRNSGIKIKGGIKYENLDVNDILEKGFGRTTIKLLWSNASPSSSFGEQTVTLTEYDWAFLICETSHGVFMLSPACTLSYISLSSSYMNVYSRNIKSLTNTTVAFDDCYDIEIKLDATTNGDKTGASKYLVPIKIYGVKI